MTFGYHIPSWLCDFNARVRSDETEFCITAYGCPKTTIKSNDIKDSIEYMQIQYLMQEIVYFSKHTIYLQKKKERVYYYSHNPWIEYDNDHTRVFINGIYMKASGVVFDEKVRYTQRFKAFIQSLEYYIVQKVSVSGCNETIILKYKNKMRQLSWDKSVVFFPKFIVPSE